jgi:hypothetical protein
VFSKLSPKTTKDCFVDSFARCGDHDINVPLSGRKSRASGNYLRTPRVWYASTGRHVRACSPLGLAALRADMPLMVSLNKPARLAQVCGQLRTLLRLGKFPCLGGVDVPALIALNVGLTTGGDGPHVRDRTAHKKPEHLGIACTARLMRTRFLAKG